MESAFGLVSDPDEFEVTEGTELAGESLRVQVSKQTEQEPSNGQLAENFGSLKKAFENDEDGEEILSLMGDGINDILSQALSLTQSTQDDTTGQGKTVQSTLTFEAIDVTQTWKFSQTLQPLTDTQQTSDSQMVDIPPSATSIHVKLENSTPSSPLYQELSEIPSSIRNLYSSVTEKYSEYCFSYMLAAQLSQEEIPMSTFNELKLSVLLSIASIQPTNPQDQPFHVIVLGSDTSLSHQLMTSIGQLARRFMAGMFDPLAGGRVLEDNFVECGATTLARTGICYIGDWSMQKPSNSARILREIESGQVIIENHSITYPLECAIWSHWNYTKKAKQDLSTIVMFLNAFGIPIVQPEQSSDAVVDFILERSLIGYEPDDQQILVPQEDIRTFLGMLFYQEVKVSKVASKLLSDYFVATRLNIPESLTQTSFSGLHKLAKAHARLCFRNEATRMDAIVAIMICERFIHNVFSNPGNTAPLADTFDTVDDLDQHIHRFDRWLKEFLKNANRGQNC